MFTFYLHQLASKKIGNVYLTFFKLDGVGPIDKRPSTD